MEHFAPFSLYSYQARICVKDLAGPDLLGSISPCREMQGKGVFHGEKKG